LRDMAHIQEQGLRPHGTGVFAHIGRGAASALLLAALLAPDMAGAQGAPRAPQAATRLSRAGGSKLPPIPPRTGPLAIQVVYPSLTDVVDAGDSSFVFGQVGDGRARLTVNGQEVKVAPNGAFLGWIRIPTDTLVTLELEAARGADTARLSYQVRRTVRYIPPTAGAWLDTMSVTPRGRVWWPKDEPLPIRLRAAPGATVEVVMPNGERFPLSSDNRLADVAWGTRAFELDTTKLARPATTDRYAGLLAALPVGEPGPLLGTPPCCPNVAPPVPAARPTIEVTLGSEKLRWAWPIQIAQLTGPGRIVAFDDDTARKGDTDGITVGRTVPSGTYYYFFPTGTRAEVSGRVNGDLRLRLSSGSAAWVPANEAMPITAGLPTRGAVVSSVRLTRSGDRVAIRIPVSWRVPFKVIEDERRLTLTLYGAQGDINWIQYGPADPLIAQVSWAQVDGEEVALKIDLADPVWGYRTRWDGNDLILEVKRPPRIDPARPLAGVRIALDAGHPPVGATGPTGFRESEANLAVARRLEQLYRAAGATVLMTRKDSMPVDLWPRIRFADSVNADLLVSIHNNALPDGVNPFTNSGTSVYYNQPRSLAWARPVEAALVRRLGLPELGVGRGDLALVRPTWMPSILTEGMFMMIPEQEAALRSAAGQRLYAQAVLDGTVAFLRERARVQSATAVRP
jgi:N-acetylmuramoyl-L-alanine amidase